MVKQIGTPQRVNISNRPLHDFIRERLRLGLDRTALVDGVTGRSYTYAEVDANVCRLASGLHRLGIQKSEVVLIFCPNSIEYIFSVFAIIANGATAAFVNPVYTAYELEHALKVTKPAWVMTVSGLLGTVIEAKKNAGSKIKKRQRRMVIQRGIPHRVEISNRPLHEFIRERMRLALDKTALVDGVTGRSYTYAEVDASVCRLASGLHRLGIQKSEVVLIFCPNSIEYIFAVFAIIANGATAAFVNPVYTPYELEHALKVTKPAWILTVSGLLGTVIEAKKNACSTIKGMIVVRDDYETPAGPPDVTLTTATAAGSSVVPYDVLISDDGSWYPKDVDIDSSKDVAFVLFSSGTTGLPKGVMLSHYNVVAMITISESAISKSPIQLLPGEQTVSVSYLPLYHNAGLIGNVVMRGLASNHKLIILDRFRPEQVLSCIEKYKVTLVFLVPSVFVFLLKYPLLSKYDISSLKRVLVGAAPAGAETLKDFMQLTGIKDIRQGYGLTETTLSCINSVLLPKIKLGSIGAVLPNTEAQVVDCESKQVLGANERGEIWVKGPQVMLGYLNDLEATKAVIDEDGWLHTGDIGYYDEEGSFFIVDRIKELIKYKSFQVAPAELESLILSHPEVADVGVIGVPDTEAGELPKAFVVRKEGSKVSAEQIKHFVAGKLASYKHLRGGVRFVEKIPKSESGKILRRILRQTEENLRSKL